MTSSSNAFLEYVLDRLAGFKGISSGRLFGGIGLSADGVQFAMIISGVLYFVVDDTTRPKYEAMGSGCFAYNTKTRRVDVRRYYEVPADVLEDDGQFTEWAKEAIANAKQTRKPERRT
ncbi:MAG: hypothetical protein AMXMBFR84_27980 [Candidatus Hydrogenedentota bacterium]